MASRTKRMKKTAKHYSPALTAVAAMAGTAAAMAGMHKVRDNKMSMDWKDAAAALGAGVASIGAFKMISGNKGWLTT